MTITSDEKSENEDGLQDAIGRRVEIDNDIGIIRYVGPVATSKKQSTTWVGIEWQTENRGKHDGSVTKDGVTHRYFKCGEKQGSFVKPIKILNSNENINGFGVNFLSGILKNYSLDNLESDLQAQNEIEQQSNYKIEFVGWKRSMLQQCDLTTKHDIILDRSNVSCIINSNNNIDKLQDTQEFVNGMFCFLFYCCNLVCSFRIYFDFFFFFFWATTIYNSYAKITRNNPNGAMY